MGRPGTFVKGDPRCNRNGRPRLTENQKRWKKILDEATPSILEKLIELAKGGDMTATKMVLDRTYHVNDQVLEDLYAKLEEVEDRVNGSGTESD